MDSGVDLTGSDNSMEESMKDSMMGVSTEDSMGYDWRYSDWDSVEELIGLYSTMIWIDLILISNSSFKSIITL